MTSDGTRTTRNPDRDAKGFLWRHAETVNHEFPSCQTKGDHAANGRFDHWAMQQTHDMAYRISALVGADSTRKVASKLAGVGVAVSHTSVAKWKAGGDIEERHLAALCEVYGRTPAWVRYGVEGHDWTPEQLAAAEIVRVSGFSGGRRVVQSNK